MYYEFKDGTVYDCKDRCTLGHDYVYEPTIFNPETNEWSAKGSMDEPMRPRLYHSVHLLLPDCRVSAVFKSSGSSKRGLPATRRCSSWLACRLNHGFMRVAGYGGWIRGQPGPHCGDLLSTLPQARPPPCDCLLP